MNENANESSRARTGPRRALRSAAGLAAMGAVLIMVLSPMAAAAHPAGAKSGIWVPSSSWSTNGCATAKASHPTFKISTGVGGFSAASSAATCKHALLGVGSSSYASADGGFQVVIPIPITSSTSGVNVSWYLNLAWSEKATIVGSSPCKPTISGNYSYYDTYLSSWINTTDYSAYCSADASVQVYGSAYILDTTTQTEYYPSNYWNGIDHSFDRYNDSYSYVTTYSNPADWSNNYSSSNSYGYSSGGSGSGVVVPASSPTWYINGTFSAHNKYVLVAQISDDTDASISGIKGATTSASITGSGASDYEDLHYAIW